MIENLQTSWLMRQIFSDRPQTNKALRLLRVNTNNSSRALAHTHPHTCANIVFLSWLASGDKFSNIKKPFFKAFRTLPTPPSLRFHINHLLSSRSVLQQFLTIFYLYFFRPMDSHTSPTSHPPYVLVTCCDHVATSSPGHMQDLPPARCKEGRKSMQGFPSPTHPHTVCYRELSLN